MNIKGDPEGVIEILSSTENQMLFQSLVNRVGYPQYVYSVEIDSVFMANMTIEDCVKALIQPLCGNVICKGGSIRTSLSCDMALPARNCYGHIIRDYSGILGNFININSIQIKFEIGEDSRLFGRKGDVDALYASISRGQRLVTVVGNAGVGKSAITVTAADYLLNRGIWFKSYYINLSNVTTLTDAMSRISFSLGIPQYQCSVSSSKLLITFDYSFIN